MGSVLAFLLILGPLVVFHELGHYLMARLFNVRADAFSVGFGPKIIAKKIGETEWRWSLIPLGCYVKLLGEDPEAPLSDADKKRALQYQPAKARFWIFFGGPLFNFILAILIFMIILVVGEENLSSRIARVTPGSLAAQQGLISGDKVISIDKETVTKFEDILQKVSENPGKTLNFEIDRMGKSEMLTITPIAQDGFSVYGEATHVGELPGMLPQARSLTFGISDPNSVAGKLGLVTGAVLVSVGLADGSSVPFQNYESFEEWYSKLTAGSSFTLNWKESAEEKAPSKSASFTKPAQSKNSLINDFGIASSELFISQVVPDSPAANAGIAKGDRIIQIGETEVISFHQLRDLVQRSGEQTGKISVVWDHNGEKRSQVLEPSKNVSRDALLKKTTQFTIGIIPMLSFAEAETVIERTFNPFMLIYKATQKTAVLTWRNLVSIGKMFTGDVSVKTLGGPILIGRLAGESFGHGLVAFLTMMAVLSVGLGILNLLPVPVLDGGHLMMLSIEVVRGKPLTIRQMEIMQQVGLSLILLLMLVVMKNDLSRLTIFNSFFN